jgi:trans-aconitate methyltransferase
MSWPATREAAQRVADAIKATASGRSGVCSIGCGTGIIEWLLQEFWPPLAVRGVDTRPVGLGLLAAEAAWSIAYGCALNPHTRNIELVHVPASVALAFFFPIPSSYCRRYVEAYEGDCIVVAPTNLDDEVGTELAHFLDSTSSWTRACSFEWPGKRQTVVTVFQRSP